MQRHRFPLYGGIALIICLAAWASSWLRIDPLYRYSFFPLWLGYILFIDALVVMRRGKSLLTRARWHYPLLFLTSSLFWWVFEGLNISVQNWHYVLDKPYSQLTYFLISSLNFSTVLPAVMETAELLQSWSSAAFMGAGRCRIPGVALLYVTVALSPILLWFNLAVCRTHPRPDQ